MRTQIRGIHRLKPSGAYSAVFSFVHGYRPRIHAVLCTTLHTTAFPPRGWRTQHVGGDSVRAAAQICTGVGFIGAGVIALSGNVILPLSIIWALVAIGVEAPDSPAGAKYTRAAVKYTALILAAKLAALAAFALKVGPEL